jgi:2-methylcitrate dehydratase PrpD
MYYAERIADWIVDLRYEEIPADVIEITKKCVFDWFCVSIYGSQSPWSKAVVDVMSEEGGREESTILVYGEKVPCGNAALANAVMTLSYDLSDTYFETALHPSCAIIASALAMGEKKKVSGKEFLTGVVAGYEVCGRVGYALNKPPQRAISVRGYEANSVIPVFSAVAAAGKIAGLDKDEMVNALGIASCSMGGGSIEYLLDGNWTYRLNPGLAARNGIFSVLIAKNGFVGPRAVFEGHWDEKGRYGVINAFAGDMSHKEDLVEGLGDREKWEIKNVGFKLYGCCHYIHGFCDTALRLMKDYDIKPGDIEEIKTKVPHMTLFLAVPPEVKVKPKNFTVSQWSLPFSLAATIVDGHLFDPMNQLSDERVNDEEVLSLSQKIKTERDRRLDELIKDKGVLQSPLEIKTKEGKKYGMIVSCKGFKENPLSEAEFETKFRVLTSKILPPDKTAKLMETIGKIEEVEDMSVLGRLI